MKKNVISEEQVKKILENLLIEDISKISRQDFNRVQFKIEELQNSLNDTIKEFRKLENIIPTNLKTPTNKKISKINQFLGSISLEINQLKESIKTYKRKIYSQSLNNS